jgi:hypothetical protein
VWPSPGAGRFQSRSAPSVRAARSGLPARSLGIGHLRTPRPSASVTTNRDRRAAPCRPPRSIARPGRSHDDRDLRGGSRWRRSRARCALAVPRVRRTRPASMGQSGSWGPFGVRPRAALARVEKLREDAESLAHRDRRGVRLPGMAEDRPPAGWSRTCASSRADPAMYDGSPQASPGPTPGRGGQRLVSVTSSPRSTGGQRRCRPAAVQPLGHRAGRLRALV